MGLQASPLSGLSASGTQNGAAPATQSVNVTSTNTASPSQSYTATVSPASATWVTLANPTGTTPGSVGANFSTAVSPGQYSASILVDTTAGAGAPIIIPVTYTVAAGVPLVITSLSPASAAAGGPTFTLTVNGTGFASGSSIHWNTAPLATSFVSATQLTASVPASLIAAAGSASITVVNTGGTASTATAFPITAAAPPITSLSPISALAGGPAFTLTVNGTSFPAGSIVQWNSTALTTSFVSSAQLSASVPASLIASAGSASITVATPAGGTSTSLSFTIAASGAPTLTGLSPTQTTAGGAAFTLTVTGAGFLSNSTVQWNGTALATTFVNSTQLTAAVPASLIASAGSENVTVATPGAAASNTVIFANRGLTITTVSPNSANPGGAAVYVIVNGTGFVANSIVQFNGTALATTFFDPTQLLALVPANLIATAGTGSITVTDPGGLTSTSAAFTISGLTVSSLSPASAVAGAPAFTLTITGTGFASGAAVSWSGTALTTTFVSATQLTASVPASLIAGAGTASVNVTSGGSTSDSLAFPVNAVTISSLSPAAGTAGSAGFTLAVNGAGFVYPSTVQWNGAALATTFVSGGQLLATIPASLVSAAGSANIIVVPPTGPATNIVSFTIAGQPLTVATSSLPAGTIGASYSQTLAASGGTAPYGDWLIGSGALPPGLNLNASSGIISGTPGSAAGSPYQFSVIASDSTGAVAAAMSLSIAVTQPAALTITSSTTMEPGTPGSSYYQGFAAVGGTTPYVNWTVTAGTLPPGLTLSLGSGGSTAALTGTPTTPGSYSFTVQVTDSANANASAQFSLEVNAANTITIYSTGIVSSADYLSGVVSPGELVAIFGSNMGPAAFTNLQLDSAGNIATILNGVEVLFDGRPAPLVYVSGTQIGVVVPYEVSGQTSTQIQVTWQGESSNVVSVPVGRAAPGIYSQNSSGSGAGSVLNVDGTLNTTSNPTTAGSYVFVYATGEGQTNPPGVDGQLNGVSAPIPTQMVTATIGGVPAYVQYAGGVASLVAGVIQVNLQVPQGVTGNNVPLIINIGGATTQQGVTIAVK